MMTWVPSFGDRALEEPSSIDVQTLFARCMGNEAFFDALLGELEGSGIRHLETIQAGLREADFRVVGHTAHSLKGAAAILAAEPIREVAEQLERACKASRHVAVPPLVERLRDEVSRCMAEIPMVRQRFHELAQ